jgi:3-oxoacyl-[acyl-carrier protein] reductase
LISVEKLLFLRRFLILRGHWLNGAVSIITGGGRGIGAATAEALAKAGAAVMLAARTTSEIEIIAERIRQTSGEAEAVTTDISDAKQVQRMVQRTIDAYGRIDFLINCAAIAGPAGQPTWEVDPKAWRQAIDVDLFGVFLTCHTVLPLMLRQGSGRVLNVSSGLGELVSPGTSAYSSAKAGVNHFTRVLAAELCGTGVTANVVYPGIVATGIYPGVAAVGLRSRLPIGRLTEDGPPILRRARRPSDVAPLLLWLCGPDTTGMTGEIVRIYDPLVQRRLSSFLRRYGHLIS